MNTSLEMAQQVLANQPFSQLLATRIVRFDSGCSELRIPITEQVRQQNGFVHGGVVSYAADNALTFAGGSSLGPAVVTSEFKINYVRPAMGEELIARANVIHAGKSQAVCRCEIYCRRDDTETLCAVAQGTITLIAR